MGFAGTLLPSCRSLSEQQEILDLTDPLATRWGGPKPRSNDCIRNPFKAAGFDWLDLKGGRLSGEEYRLLFDHFLNVSQLEDRARVEPAGIEPATSSMPRKRAPAAPRPHMLTRS